MKKNSRKKIAAFLCSAVIAAGAMSALTGTVSAADAVSFTRAEGWFETAVAEWAPVSGADGYNVYADGKQVDSMLIR
ncbi:MAG: hypothetical protein IJM46_01415 [Oscillospiraceae bacterium]|nr:hypothetical protein [Oscillospiraceae bacterium]